MAAAEQAHAALQNSQVYLDGVIIGGDWKKNKSGGKGAIVASSSPPRGSLEMTSRELVMRGRKDDGAGKSMRDLARDKERSRSRRRRRDE